jgi:site-specific DNA-methyltransferase (adenine-specific)
MIEKNHVYKMDCLDGLREMAREGIFVDCIITDPPYLINYKTHRRKDKGHKFCTAIKHDDNPQLIKELIPLLYDVLKDNAPLYMFCNSDKVDFFKQEVEKYFTFKNLIVWDKGHHTAGDLAAQYGKRYEFILYANKGRAPFMDGQPRYEDIWRCGGGGDV